MEMADLDFSNSNQNIINIETNFQTSKSSPEKLRNSFI